MFREILIADDHSIIRFGLSVAFEAQFKDLKINLAENYFEAEKIIAEKHIDLFIMDIQMPGVDKFAIRNVKMISPNTKILLFSGFAGETMHHLIAEGADGYLNKQCSYQQIIEGVLELYNTGTVFLPETIGKNISLSDRISLKKILSKREYEIFIFLVEGKGNLEITNMLSLK